MKVAIIGGSGKMGQWFTGFLVKDGKEVVIYARDQERLREAGLKYGAKTAGSLEEAVSGVEYILVSVPIDSFEGVIGQLRPLVSPEQTVIDITSVKLLPVEIMHRHLDSVPVLGTHPVFGPGAKSARNQNFVLTPTNSAESALAGKIRGYLEQKGAKVSIMSPQEHDELMAVILGLSHFIAIVSADVLLGFERLEQMKAIGGPTYKVLLTLAESVITEDPDLYASIQMNLPHMADMEELFRKSSGIWADIVKNKDRQAFAGRMRMVKERLVKSDPEFGRSYEDMYKLLEER